MTILVSICCITYNHEKYIRQCLDGFVMQKTTFPFEVLVHEDASTDSTANIVKEYELKYPNLFRCVYQTENQFLKQNTLVNILFKMAKGKYIALCEGDDYWIDPFKLQKQVNFLEGNQGCALCFHDVKILQPNGIIVEDFITNVPKAVKLDQEALVVNSNFIHTPSVMFRSEYLNDMPTMDSPVGDYLLYLWLTNFGDIGYIPESMGVYRYGVGIHSSKSEEQRIKEHFWVMLVASFLVNNPEMVKILDRKLLNFLKGYPQWSELTLDYRFPAGIQKYLELCTQLYQGEKKLNVKDQSIRYLIYELRKRILHRIKQY